MINETFRVILDTAMRHVDLEYVLIICFYFSLHYLLSEIKMH